MCRSVVNSSWVRSPGLRQWRRDASPWLRRRLPAYERILRARCAKPRFRACRLRSSGRNASSPWSTSGWRTSRMPCRDPVSRHLEELPAAWRAVTVGQLATHTSGLPGDVELGMTRTVFGDDHDVVPHSARTYTPYLVVDGRPRRTDVLYKVHTEFPPMLRTCGGMNRTAEDIAHCASAGRAASAQVEPAWPQDRPSAERWQSRPLGNRRTGHRAPVSSRVLWRRRRQGGVWRLSAG